MISKSIPHALKRSLAALISVVMCLSAFSFSAFAAEDDTDTSAAVTFKDDALVRALCTALGKEYTEDVTITEDEMLNITSLDLSDSEVWSIEGLQYATNLEYLDLSGSKIAEKQIFGNREGYYFAKLTKLEYLDISNCGANAAKSSWYSSTLRSIAGLPNLKTFKAANNNIAGTVYLSDTAYTAIEDFDLSGNRITALVSNAGLTADSFPAENVKINLSDNAIYLDESSDGYSGYVNVGLDKFDFSNQKNLALVSKIYVENLTTNTINTQSANYEPDENNVIDLGTVLTDTISFAVKGSTCALNTAKAEINGEKYTVVGNTSNDFTADKVLVTLDNMENLSSVSIGSYFRSTVDGSTWTYTLDDKDANEAWNKLKDRGVSTKFWGFTTLSQLLKIETSTDTLTFKAHDSDKSATIYVSSGTSTYDLTPYAAKSDTTIKVNGTEVASGETYTDDSYSAMTTALEAAQEVAANELSSQEEVDNAKAALDAAVDALTVDESKLADKTALNAAIDEAEALEQGTHTDTSWNTLQDAIASAQEVADDIYATDKEVSSAVTALNAVVTVFNNSGEATKLDKDNLADGTYTVQAELIKTDRQNKSMANNAINHTVTITVENGEYYATLDFKGMTINLLGEDYFGYLSKLYYYNAGYTYEYGYPKGSTTEAEVLTTQKNSDGTDVIDKYNDADNLYPDLVKIKLVDKASEEYVPLQVFVPIMESISEGNGTQPVLMKIDWTSLKAGSADTTDDDEPTEPVTPDEPETVLWGDANCDGRVDISDATAIQKHIAKISTLTANGEKLADVNGDNVIDIIDATVIQKYIAQIITKFPVED